MALNCSCTHSDAWRCARAKNQSGPYITCQCACHRRGPVQYNGIFSCRPLATRGALYYLFDLSMRDVVRVTGNYSDFPEVGTYIADPNFYNGERMVYGYELWRLLFGYKEQARGYGAAWMLLLGDPAYRPLALSHSHRLIWLFGRDRLAPYLLSLAFSHQELLETLLTPRYEEREGLFANTP